MPLCTDLALAFTVYGIGHLSCTHYDDGEQEGNNEMCCTDATSGTGLASDPLDPDSDGPIDCWGDDGNYFQGWTGSPAGASLCIKDAASQVGTDGVPLCSEIGLRRRRNHFRSF